MPNLPSQGKFGQVIETKVPCHAHELPYFVALPSTQILFATEASCYGRWSDIHSVNYSSAYIPSMIAPWVHRCFYLVLYQRVDHTRWDLLALEIY